MTHAWTNLVSVAGLEVNAGRTYVTWGQTRVLVVPDSDAYLLCVGFWSKQRGGKMIFHQKFNDAPHLVKAGDLVTVHFTPENWQQVADLLNVQ